MRVLASLIADFLDVPLKGANGPISGFCSAQDERPDGYELLSFYNQAPPIWTPRRGLTILPPGAVLVGPSVSVKNPRLAFIKVVDQFFPNDSAEYCRVNGFLTRDRIRPGGYSTLPNIGRGTVVRDSAVVHTCVTLGEDCLVQSSSVIGEEGFGYEPDDNGHILRFPHIGRVIVGNRVVIGSNTTICRGSLSDTVIDDDVKIDGLCFVAHNVHVGPRSMLVGRCEISGSVNIGADCWIGPGSAIIDHVTIGDGAFLGVGAVVIRDVPPRAVVVGNPAKIIRYR